MFVDSHEHRTSGMAESEQTEYITKSWFGLRLRSLRGVAQNAYPLAFVYDVYMVQQKETKERPSSFNAWVSTPTQNNIYN